MTRVSGGLDDLLPQVELLVRGIVRLKLRAQFRRPDLSETQDALDVVSSVIVEVAHRVRGGRVSVDAVREYAAVVAYHACAEYLRNKRAPRHRLHLKLRYFLSHHRSFAVWDGPRGRLCGFTEWAHDDRRIALADRLLALRRDVAAAVPQAMVFKHPSDMKPGDWAEPLSAMFEWLGGAVLLSELNTIVATMTLTDSGTDSENREQPDEAPSPEEQAAASQLFRAVWRALQQLPLHWRRAFLLNPPRGFELEELPARGIATIEEIGAAIALNGGEYELLWSALSIDPTAHDLDSHSTTAERFAFLWRYLPLRDAAIAKLFNEDPQHVINLRRIARDGLRDRLTAVQSRPRDT